MSSISSTNCTVKIMPLKIFFFLRYGDHRDLLVLTHSFPTRRASDLLLEHARYQPSYDDAARDALDIAAALGKTTPLHEITDDMIATDRKSTRLNSSH